MPRAPLPLMPRTRLRRLRLCVGTCPRRGNHTVAVERYSAALDVLVPLERLPSEGPRRAAYHTNRAAAYMARAEAGILREGALQRWVSGGCKRVVHGRKPGASPGRCTCPVPRTQATRCAGPPIPRLVLSGALLAPARLLTLCCSTSLLRAPAWPAPHGGARARPCRRLRHVWAPGGCGPRLGGGRGAAL